jgi:3-mercaptopyruvate sulfurtransferase SseA
MESSSPLIETTELQALIEAGSPLIILDFTLNMTDHEAPQQAHFESRLPNAKFIKFTDTVDKTAAAPMTLPKTKAFRSLCSRLEIANNEAPLVVYD